MANISDVVEVLYNILEKHGDLPVELFVDGVRKDMTVTVLAEQPTGISRWVVLHPTTDITNERQENRK